MENKKNKHLVKSVYFNYLTKLFLILILFAEFGLASYKNIRFEQISIEDGLSQAGVFCILQDMHGFMWFGTEDGLNKFDGYKFTIYRSNPDDSTSLSNNYISSLYEDSAGDLWVGTRNGLNKFDRSREKFTRFHNNVNNPISLSNNYVMSICEDSDSNLWIGTESGLNKFDGETFTIYRRDGSNNLSSNFVRYLFEDTKGVLWIGTEEGLCKFDGAAFTAYYGNPDDITSISNNSVRSIYEDNKGNLWVGTRDGLNKLDRKSGKFTRFQHQINDPLSICNNYIRTIYEDSDGNLWIGTQEGLNKFDGHSFTTYRHDPHNDTSLGSNSIWSFFEDEGGICWVGTYGAGISKFDRTEARFTHYKNQIDDPQSLNKNSIRSIFEDSGGVLWIGTDGGGLNKLDRTSGHFTHYMNQADNPQSLSNNYVRVVYEDTHNNFWVGTRDGLNKFDRKAETFTHFRNQADNPHSISGNNIRSIFEDTKGNLWIGANDEGLNKFDIKEEKFTSFLNEVDNPNSLSHNRVYAIYEDSKNNLWIGTGDGLNKFDGNQFTVYRHNPYDSTSLSNNLILSLYEDNRGNLWIGTGSGGLNKLDREQEKFIRYREKDGLPNEVVYNILEDDNGNLWMSTNKGISRFNPITEVFTNYDDKDGLQCNEFNWGAACKDRMGRMYFGGINGFNEFYPDSIKDNTYISPVVITDFLLFNKSVPVGDESVLKTGINLARDIVLDYTDYIFAFEFSALNYRQPEKNRFAYMLENFNDEWIDTDYKHRRATYTNLPPGNYTFRVKASNDDGYWNEEGASISITILPPFWETWWFRFIIVCLILLIIFSIHKSQTYYIKKRNKELEKYNLKLNTQIEERKRAETEMRHLRNLLGNIVNSMPSILIGVDIDGKVTLWNKKAEQTTGITTTVAQGKHLSDVFPRMASEIIKIKRSIQAGKIIRESKKPYKTEDGTRYEDFTIYPLIDNLVLGAVIRIDDVTKEQELQDQLSHVRKMDAIGQLAGGVAHDFNNMIGGIMGAAQLLQSPKRNLGKENMEFIDIILKAASRAADLTAKLLAFGRKGKMASTEINIHKVIDDTVAILRRTIDKKIKLVVRRNAENHIVVGDYSGLQNSLMNLGINASHAMKDGGVLRIETKNIYLEETYCRVSPFDIEPGDFVEIEVRDTGCGISLDNLKKIFEPYFTTKEQGKGTGLGLAAVYGTVQDHRGAINVYSELGNGTVFHILLPCSDVNASKEDVDREIATGSGKILLVDDEDIIRTTGKLMLEEMGYDVIVAKNGKECVEKYTELHAGIDLVILDMIMPVMNGREAFHKIKDIDPECKVVISSGFSKDGDLDELQKSGLSGFIVKPFKNYELSRLIKEILSE